MKQQSNGDPKIRGVLLISNYMVKKYGIEGAIDRIIKKNSRAKATWILKHGKQVNVYAIQDDGAVFNFKGTVSRGPAACAEQPITSAAPTYELQFTQPMGI